MRKIGCLLSLGALGMTPLVAGCGPEPLEHTSEAVSALSQNLVPEIEPNGGAVQATVIGNDTVVRANIFASTDTDFFRVNANAGDRIFAATMTGFSAATTTSQLAFVGLDGLTVLESDDNNGFFAGGASSIAGATAAMQGNHFLRVTHLNNNAQIRPYDLHVKVQSGMPTAETEPNDMTAQMLPMGGYVSGTTATAGDIDSYALMLQAGDTIFASLDVNPERDATEWNGRLTFASMTQPALVVDDGDAGAGADSEALFATVQATGMYEIRVGSPNGGGTYLLSVSVHPGADTTPNCTTYTSADIPKTIGPNNNQPASSTIMVPGNPRIADIDVAIQLNHQKADDIDVHLISPAGNTNALFTDIGGTGALAMNTTVDDEGAFPINSLGAPMSGLVMQPENNYRLHWFDGEDAGGTWTLVINDDANNNGGTLTGWSIRICEPPMQTVSCGIGMPVTMYSSDFEVDAGGFTTNGTAIDWTRGTPNSAPIATCNSGTQCWKTNLMGTHSNNSNQNLVSPPVSLSGLKAPIALSWAMKYQMETATNDRIWVEVREAGGANPQRVWQFLDDTMQTQIQVNGNNVNLAESAGWGVHNADVSAFAGKNIEVVFHLESNGGTAFAGFAVDDVSVVGCPSVVCGDGVKEGTEECDDGNMANGDGCDNNCTMTRCGNGIKTVGEMCDDGNLIDGDNCDSNCTPTGCGNGITTAGETCDDGNMMAADGCSDICAIEMGYECNGAPSVCGLICSNGKLDTGEGCDDGNTMNNDGCSDTCAQEMGYSCMGEPSTCTTTCGDTIIAGAEICDDGNLVDGDNCDSNCTVTGCGNGIMTSGELCDDGNLIDGDNCDSNCTATGCGNGIMTSGETCDDGNTTMADGCSDACAVEMGYECMGTPSTCAKICGNGKLDAGEGCDDGNSAANDGCSDTCVAETGYSCTGEPSTCSTTCGDNIVAGAEQCDDGNTKNGDGCSDMCTTEGAGGSGGGGAGGGGNGGTGGENPTGGAGGSAGSGGGTPGDDGSCNCSMPGQETAPNASFWAGLFAAIGFLRRRNNTRKSR